MTAIFTIVAVLSTIVAVLCLPALFFWMFGVPGVAGNFADGWTIGLTVLILYPISYFVVYFSTWIVWMLHLSDKVSKLAFVRWQQGATIAAIYILIKAALRMYEAFRVMSSQ